MKITFGIIPYTNYDAAYHRIVSVIIPTIAHNKHHEYEVVCVNNGPQHSQLLDKGLKSCSVPITYLWNGGKNLQYGPAVEQIVALAKHPILVYICAHHGRINKQSWLDELIAPLEQPKVAMAGDLAASCLARAADIDMDGPAPHHIQGGIFAAKTEVMRQVKYNPRLPHLCSDIWYCWKLRQEGFELADVPSVRSAWRMKVPNSHLYSYVHEE